ncbi:hypothetical protein, partial [Oleiagrimonas sp.]|uniref:hypothetical protein n=1 Tax=Oleiagrimonas sp. TaxID=2010330 RepID=UPI0026192AA5
MNTHKKTLLSVLCAAAFSFAVAPMAFAFSPQTAPAGSNQESQHAQEAAEQHKDSTEHTQS